MVEALPVAGRRENRDDPQVSLFLDLSEAIRNV
jgi:hypothetical protein